MKTGWNKELVEMQLNESSMNEWMMNLFCKGSTIDRHVLNDCWIGLSLSGLARPGRRGGGDVMPPSQSLKISLFLLNKIRKFSQIFFLNFTPLQKIVKFDFLVQKISLHPPPFVWLVPVLVIVVMSITIIKHHMNQQYQYTMITSTICEVENDEFNVCLG